MGRRFSQPDHADEEHDDAARSHQRLAQPLQVVFPVSAG
jgi:hypothetical protein